MVERFFGDNDIRMSGRPWPPLESPCTSCSLGWRKSASMLCPRLWSMRCDGESVLIFSLVLSIILFRFSFWITEAAKKVKTSPAHLLYAIIGQLGHRILTNAIITAYPKGRCPFRHHSWRSKTMTSMKTSARLLLLRFSLNLEPRCLVSRPVRRYFFIQPGVPSMGDLQ